MTNVRLLASVLILALSISLCSAQTSVITRFEETDPHIFYGGNSVIDSSATLSAGQAIILDENGGRTALTFAGTGIVWIGSTGPNRGVARVYLDGNISIVDTYSDNRLDQQVLFVAKGLTPGLHTLVIEVTQMRNLKATGSGVSIDAFDIQNGAIVAGGVIATPGYIEQTSPAVNYSGVWFANNSDRASGGSAVLAMDPGSRATVSFAGTGITWIGYRDPWSGVARVYLDGVLITTLDTFDLASGTDQHLDEIWQRPIWSTSNLPNGNHTLTIEVLGQRGPNSSGNWIWIDAFRIEGPVAPAP